MSKRSRRRLGRKAASQAAPPTKGRRGQLFGLVVFCAVAALVAVLAVPHRPKSAAAYQPRPAGTLTFNQDIAPIIFQQCAGCHAPGQSAPFSLLNFKDVAKRAKLIAEVVQKRIMPPWLPDSSCGPFIDECRLSADQVGIITQWVAEGASEGRGTPPGPPPPPKQWQLGQPDLVVPMPAAYHLGPDGKDVYRNFVFPIPLTRPRYVKAVEFHPGNPQVLHHAFIHVDTTRRSRLMADAGNPPSFDGMRVPDSARMPGGQLLGWRPGKTPFVDPPGLAWLLETNADLVLQLHMHPSGKPELVQPTLGFYFTDEPPTNSPFRLNLCSYLIDIPAGAQNYAISNQYVLPIDVDLLAITPHTHYLGKRLEGSARLPDGSRKELLLIQDWDFNWQGDYRYAEPVFLPRGTTLFMHFTFDNSTNNVRNPSTPPRRVKYGLQTTDEMGELWFQVLPRDPSQRPKLAQDFFIKLTEDAVRNNEYLIARDPSDPMLQVKLGAALLALHRNPEAAEHFQAALKLRPDIDEAHFDLGTIYLMANQLSAAQAEFERVLQLNPKDYQAHGSLGYVYLRQNNLDGAQSCFESALRLNPDDAVARKNLELVAALRNGQGRLP